jgi:hypothetical protein
MGLTEFFAQQPIAASKNSTNDRRYFGEVMLKKIV